jgi:hypothetical protein
MVRRYVRHWQLHRSEARIVLPAIAAPWIANFIHVAGLSPFPFIDSTILAMAATGPALAFSVLRGVVCNILPIAQSRWIDELDEGLLVTDCEQRILLINQPAREIFAALGATQEAMAQVQFPAQYGWLEQALAADTSHPEPI